MNFILGGDIGCSVDASGHGVTFDLALLTLTFEILLWLYLLNIRCRKLILGFMIGWVI